MTSPVVDEARRWIGTPYRHQASVRGAGCDCLGLVRGVWRVLHGREPEAPPPYAPDWAEALGRETLLEAAARHLDPVATPEPGDVLLFRWRAHLPAKHCAILATPGTMIHAHDGAEIAEVAFTGWWRRHLAGAFRFPDPHTHPLSPRGRGWPLRQQGSGEGVRRKALGASRSPSPACGRGLG